MGSSKVSLPYRGSTVLGTVLRQLHATVVDRVVVVTGYHAREVEPIASEHGVDVVRNPDPDRGNLSSVLTGWEAVRAEADAALVVLGDMPGIDCGVVDRIVGEWAPPLGAVVPEYTDGPGHPLLVAGDLIDGLTAAHMADQPLWSAIWDLPDTERRSVSIASPRPRDINTPADYRSAD